MISNGHADAPSSEMIGGAHSCRTIASRPCVRGQTSDETLFLGAARLCLLGTSWDDCDVVGLDRKATTDTIHFSRRDASLPCSTCPLARPSCSGPSPDPPLPAAGRSAGDQPGSHASGLADAAGRLTARAGEQSSSPGRRKKSVLGGGSMRRRPGIAGLQNAAATRDKFRLVGENVAKVRTDVMQEQLATFRSQLEEFARKHKSDIRKNSVFRQQFHEMCAKVGVDPLASNKGVWAELLGIGGFYYELGVQIVDICIATRSLDGGLIDLLELRKLLCQKRKTDLGSLSADDCLRAISKLKVLGSGFEVFSVGKKKLVRSVPTELNKDHNGILELAQSKGYVTVDQVEKEFSWASGRAVDALETLLKEGLAMIDDGHRDGKRRYWFPCVTLSSDGTGGS